MSGKEKKPNYSALVRQVVHDAPEPLPLAEILQRVNRISPIEPRSPETTIRNAVSQCYLIANTGDGKYGWYPRMLKGSFIRAQLVKSDLKQKQIIFDYDARELLWPGFFAGPDPANREPVNIFFPDGSKTQLSLEHFEKSIWGTTGSESFWKWLAANKAKGGDFLIIEAIDVEKKN